MMSWIARNSSDRSSAALAASEIRYVAVCSCAAWRASVASVLEPAARGRSPATRGHPGRSKSYLRGGGTYLRYHLYEARPLQGKAPIEVAHAAKIPPPLRSKPLAAPPPLDIVVPPFDLAHGGPAHLAAHASALVARGGESRPARRRAVLRLDRIRDPAAVLGGKRDRGRVQHLAYARGTAAGRCDVGGEAVHDPVLHVPLRMFTTVHGVFVLTLFGGGFTGRGLPTAATFAHAVQGAGIAPAAWGLAAQSRGIVRVQLHRYRGIQIGAGPGADVPSIWTGPWCCTS